MVKLLTESFFNVQEIVDKKMKLIYIYMHIFGILHISKERYVILKMKGVIK